MTGIFLTLVSCIATLCSGAIALQKLRQRPVRVAAATVESRYSGLN